MFLYKNLVPSVGNVTLAAIGGVLMVLPFAILEVVNSSDARHDFAFALFVFIWLLSSVFLIILLSTLRRLRNVVGGTKLDVADSGIGRAADSGLDVAMGKKRSDTVFYGRAKLRLAAQ